MTPQIRYVHNCVACLQRTGMYMSQTTYLRKCNYQRTCCMYLSQVFKIIRFTTKQITRRTLYIITRRRILCILTRHITLHIIIRRRILYILTRGHTLHTIIRRRIFLRLRTTGVAPFLESHKGRHYTRQKQKQKNLSLYDLLLLHINSLCLVLHTMQCCSFRVSVILCVL